MVSSFAQGLSKGQQAVLLETLEKVECTNMVNVQLFEDFADFLDQVCTSGGGGPPVLGVLKGLYAHAQRNLRAKCRPKPLWSNSGNSTVAMPQIIAPVAKVPPTGAASPTAPSSGSREAPYPLVPFGAVDGTGATVVLVPPTGAASPTAPPPGSCEAPSPLVPVRAVDGTGSTMVRALPYVGTAPGIVPIKGRDPPPALVPVEAVEAAGTMRTGCDRAAAQPFARSSRSEEMAPAIAALPPPDQPATLQPPTIEWKNSEWHRLVSTMVPASGHVVIHSMWQIPNDRIH